ncbi:MAG TPA: SDR family oxidoreductase [Ktedonobacterales bacterium]
MSRALFKEQVVIITGASSGIGKELAYQLASQGAWLALAARSLDKLEAVAAECRQRGAKALVVQTDVTDEAQCQRLMARTIETYGRIDVLINNAGYGRPKRFEALPNLASLKAEMELNYYGVVHCTYYALPYLKQSKGRLVGVCSFDGQVGIPGTIGYNSAKHAMRGFLNTLRAELRGSGVSVTVLYLGAIRTERLVEAMGANVNKIPTMSPERCAALILRSAARRKRQLVMTLPGKLLVWLNLLAPALLDWILVNVPGISYEE